MVHVFRWLKNLAPVEKNKRTRIRNKDIWSKLVITDLDVLDSGYYQCTAANAAGSVNTTSVLRVSLGLYSASINNLWAIIALPLVLCYPDNRTLSHVLSSPAIHRCAYVNNGLSWEPCLAKRQKVPQIFRILCQCPFITHSHTHTPSDPTPPTKGYKSFGLGASQPVPFCLPVEPMVNRSSPHRV